jgi:hypothetical protein
MGPKPPVKKEEPEEPAEKVPLSDARKGRARGPARRKPAVTAVPKAEPVPAEPAVPEIKITDSWNVWQVDENGALVVGDRETAKASTPESSPSPVLSTKDAISEPVESKPSNAPEVEASPVKESPVDDVVQETEVSKSINDESATDDLKSTPVVPEVDNPPSSSENAPVKQEELDDDDDDQAKDEERKAQPQEAVASPIDTKDPSPPIAAISTDAPEKEVEENVDDNEDDDITDKDLENMTASADGKRVSDGDVKV